MSPRNLRGRVQRARAARRRRYLLDLAERTAATFVQGFLSVVTLDALSQQVDLDLHHQLSAGALAGGYAVLKAFAARATGSPDSASLLPADLDPPQEKESP